MTSSLIVLTELFRGGPTQETLRVAALLSKKSAFTSLTSERGRGLTQATLCPQLALDLLTRRLPCGKAGGSSFFVLWKQSGVKAQIPASGTAGLWSSHQAELFGLPTGPRLPPGAVRRPRRAGETLSHRTWSLPLHGALPPGRLQKTHPEGPRRPRKRG